MEVGSPTNTSPELREKKRRYLEAGADQVWICGEDGAMSSFLADSPDDGLEASLLCPEFSPSLPRGPS